MSLTEKGIRFTELSKTLLFSEELHIDLRSKGDAEVFKWFLASILYGARITQSIAKNTYRAFERHKLLTPRAILDAGWEFLVSPVMREGGYVRYDGRKSTQILRDCEKLLKDYRGSLFQLHQEAADSHELEELCMDFYGVGPVTTNIFLRELRPFWKKANPEPLKKVVELARERRISLSQLPRKSITFTRIEAGLIRSLTNEGEARKVGGLKKFRPMTEAA